MVCLLFLSGASDKLYAQHFSVKLYGLKDGLPNTIVHSVYQDRYGYLWLATPSGVSRFDGRQFVNYGITDGLPSLNVLRIFHDSHQRLWVGTASGMVQFKGNRFIGYPTSDGKINTYVYNLNEIHGLTCAFTDKGAYEFAGTLWKKINLYPGFTDKPCRNAVEIGHELYVSYPKDIFCKSRTGWKHIASADKHGNIFNMMTMQNDKLWVSEGRNVYQVTDKGLVLTGGKEKPQESYSSYLFDWKNRLWGSETDTLRVSSPGDWQHFPFVMIKNGNFYSVNRDSVNNAWASTMFGLIKMTDIEYTTIGKENAPLIDGIYNIIALPDGRTMLSSGTKNGLLIYNNKTLVKLPPPGQSISNNYYHDPVDAYAFDGQNRLWMGTRFRKLLRFDGARLKDFTSGQHLKRTENTYDMCYAPIRKKLFACADSTLLYGTLNGERPALSVFIPRNTGVPIVKPTRVYEVKNGLLLLYVDGKGVFGIDQADNLFPLIKQTGIDGRGKGVQLGICFCEDKDHNFWVAVPGLGLYEYGFGLNKLPFLRNHFTVNDGLQGSGILSIISDNKKRLWMASETGLDILQMTPAKHWDIFNYARPEDLNLTVSAYQKLALDKDGNVWLSSPDKVIKFNADGITLRKRAPRIILEKVSLAFKETDWSKLTDSLYSYFRLPYNPVLNYDQNSLGIFFNAVDLSISNSNPEYSYKLLPLDTGWSIPSKGKSVSFAQLPAGKYQFVVRAKDKASGWSKPAVFTFTIDAPFWNKWWFRLIVIATASFIITSIFRARIRKIRNDAGIANQLRELEMKALKAQMNPHFIYNALNSIQALFESDKKDDGIRYIGSFSRLLRQVLENSENNVINLDKELETIGLYIQLESLRLDMKLNYKKHINPDIVTEFEEIPPLILQPFIENALWHGLSRKEGGKQVSISITESDDWLIFEITDNGVGRAKAEEWKSKSVTLHQSKGMDITRQRLIDFNDDNTYPPIEFVDLYDDENNAAGTRAIIHIKRKFNTT